MHNMGTHYFFGSYNPFRPFIIVVNSGADSQFTIPTFGGGYNYKLDTSDGQSFVGLTGNHTIIFPAANTDYTLEISGLFPRWSQNNNAERLKLKLLVQDGDVIFNNVQSYSFFGGGNLNGGVNYAPTLSSLTVGLGMYYQCYAFNPPNYAPALSALTNGVQMYYQCYAFNPPNYAPTLSALTNGLLMYYQCYAFNPPNYAPALSVLTVGQAMYYQCYAFNPPNYAPALSALTNGQQMYEQCTNFNPPNYAPTLSVLTNGFAMYYLCTAFSQDFIQDDPIFGTLNLQNIQFMFTNIKSKKIRLQAGSVTSVNSSTFQCPLLEELILIGMKPTFWINTAPNLLGAKIDDLANSVADRTGFASSNITMTLAQRTSCNQALWTAKNWTISI
jgi:hypothetical protein